MASKTYTRALRQAKLSAALQTDPQASALRLLLRQAQSTYSTGVHQARGGALILGQAARHAEPQMAKYFSTAGESIARNLGSVGIDPHTVQGPAQADIADTLNRLATTQASAQGELTQRGVDAAAGANYQVQNLGNQRAASVSKIGQQLLDLAGQKGKLTQSTYLTLLDQAAGRSVTRRGQTLSHRDRVASQNAQQNSPSAQKTKAELDYFNKHGYFPPTGPPKKGKGGSGSGRQPSVGLGSLTPFQESKVRDQVSQVVSVIKSAPKKDDNGKPLTDHALRQHLMNGTSPLKKPVPTDLVNIAFDLARLGYLSVPNMRALHQRGLHIPRNWLAKRIPGVTPGIAGPPPPGV